MRTKRFLLVTSALSTAAMVGGCTKKKPVIYANPKGAHYAIDAGVPDGGSESGSAMTPDKPDDKPDK